MEINFQTNNFLSSTRSVVVLCFFFKKFPHHDKCCEVQCVWGVNILIKCFTKNKKKVREVSIEVLIKKMQNHKIHDTFLTAHLGGGLR